MRMLRSVRVWLGVVVVVALVALATWPETLPVDVAVAARGPLQVTGIRN